MTKIDCHTHILNHQMAFSYFSRTDGYAIVMQFLTGFCKDGIGDDSFNAAMADERLFWCPVIDIHGDIKGQLDKIETFLPNERIVGIKIFLTYQSGRADDKKMLPIYRFADKHRLTVTFHTGACSLILPSDNDLDGSNAVYVRNAAKQFPNVNFVLAHMDDPRYDECIRVIHGQKNMFTDFCGAYEPGTPEGEDYAWAVERFAQAINQYPDTYKQMLYGTDFCPDINLFAVEEYEDTISEIFKPEQFDDVYFNNCLRAFPKIREYMERKNVFYE